MDSVKTEPSETGPELVPEIVEADTVQVVCDGGVGAMGHPRVYLNMGDKGFVDCPYCDRRFVLKEGAARPAAH